MKQAELSLHHIARAAQVPDGRRPPLLLLLHGIGSNEEDLFALAPALPPTCLVISLRGRLTLQPGAYAWFHAEFLPDGIEIEAGEEKESRAAVLKVIDEAVEAYGADPDQVYLMGFSQGAIMSLSIMLTHPEKIAAVVAMSGRVLEEVKPGMVAPEKLEGFPVLIAHGVADEVIPIRYARAALEYLRPFNVKLFYREYGMGHTVTEDSLTDILEWLNEVMMGQNPEQDLDTGRFPVPD
jgi:phospholipase/carboxylesterase